MDACRALRILLAGFMLAAGYAAAADSIEKKYPLPDHGVFQMKVPAEWVERLQPAGSNPPTINYLPKQGNGFHVLVTPLWRGRPDVQMPGKDEIRQRVAQAVNSARNSAVEKDIKVVELAGASGPGYYFSVTDKAPKPGEFKFMSQGMLRVNDLLVTFTVLTNDGNDQIVRDALAMLKTAVNPPQ